MDIEEIKKAAQAFGMAVLRSSIVRLGFSLLLVGSAFYVGALSAMGFSAIVLVDKPELMATIATYATVSGVLVAISNALGRASRAATDNLKEKWTAAGFLTLPSLKIDVPGRLPHLFQNVGAILVAIGAILMFTGLLTLNFYHYSSTSIAFIVLGMFTMVLGLLQVQRALAVLALNGFLGFTSLILGIQWIAYLRDEAPTVTMTLVEQAEPLQIALAMRGSHGLIGFVESEEGVVYIPWDRVERIVAPPDEDIRHRGSLRFWEWVWPGADATSAMPGN